MTTTNAKHIVAESFTYDNINSSEFIYYFYFPTLMITTSEIPQVLGLEVLFDGELQSESEDNTHAVHGGFGRVYRVNLSEPLTVRFSTLLASFLLTDVCSEM